MKTLEEQIKDLQNEREELIRVLRIAIGYVQVSADQGVGNLILSDRSDLAKQHVVEIRAALDKSIPPANKVLNEMGHNIKRLKDLLGKVSKECSNTACRLAQCSSK